MPQANEYMAKKEELEAYQLKLVPGTGITINPTTNVISATGGGGGSSVSYTNVWEFNTNPIIGTLDIDNVDNYIRIPQLIPGTNMQITQDSTTGAFTFNATGGGNVDDVQVDGTSVVTNKIAEISTMSGATSQADGSGGLVPAPETTDLGKFLSASGDWEAAAAAEELTKAQYDALPASKNSDDIFYYITDLHIIMHNGVQYGGTGGTTVVPNPVGTPTDTLDTIEIDGDIYEIQGGGGGGTNLILDAAKYSTNEQIIGIWTNNKPLYEKTYNLNFTPDSTDYTYTIDTLSNEIEVQRILDGGMYCDGTLFIPVIYFPSDIGYCFRFTPASHLLSARIFNRQGNVVEGTVTIQYTKTTDTAGSGGYQAYGFTPVIYSNMEREIGVWKDNKPLYQKTIEITNSFSSTREYTDSDLAGAETLIIYDGYYIASTSSGEYRLPLNYSESGYDAYTGYRTYNHSLFMRCNGFTSTKCVITVQYTKTSDVVGSSTYNILGVPNVHYTTTEQVIGTWIDDKPLYQKTLTLTSIATDTSWHNVAHGIANINEVTKIDGILKETGTNHFYSVNSYRPGQTVGISVVADPTNIIYMQNWIDDIDFLKITLQYTKTTD